LASALETIKGELETTKGELETTKGNLETTEGALETTKGELETTKGKNITKIETLTNEINALKSGVLDLKNNLVKKDTEISILNYARDELNHLKSLRSYQFISFVKKILLKFGFYKTKGFRGTKGKVQKENASAPLDVLRSGRKSDSVKSQKQLKIASILDTFTYACFEPEAQLITFRPDNWEKVMSGSELDLLLVESAWHGNDGAWQYRIGTYSASPGRELFDVIDWCRKEGLPTVFWNKEDPPHFNQFIEAAREFDYVFTTDENCIPKYRELCGHDRIFALPFAAQPTIHNPVLSSKRQHDVCFAGTYYANRFDERRDEMEMLLRVASDYDFEIYDRMHGYVGAGSGNYRFPEEFQKFIRGRLEYEDMVKAYRHYKVFLNVNSVANSKTMFSRRVFELLACGTPVVSTQSTGINHFFGDIVPLVGNEGETREALRHLIADDEHWSRTSARGIRLVMDQHTYENRLSTICDVVGLSPQDTFGPSVVVVLTIEGSPERISAILQDQTKKIDTVFVVSDGDENGSFAKRMNEHNVKAESVKSSELMQKLQRDEYRDTRALFMSSKDFYGPNYVKDAVASLNYSGLGLSGMSSYFSWDSNSRLSFVKDSGPEHFICQSVLASTLIAKLNVVDIQLVRQVVSGGLIKMNNPCYARARYEFAQCLSSDHPSKSAFDNIVLN
jgi:spore maturation protein CgeB